jgi:hypothetical protein
VPLQHWLGTGIGTLVLLLYAAAHRGCLSCTAQQRTRHPSWPCSGARGENTHRCCHARSHCFDRSVRVPCYVLGAVVHCCLVGPLVSPTSHVPAGARHEEIAFSSSDEEGGAVMPSPVFPDLMRGRSGQLLGRLFTAGWWGHLACPLPTCLQAPAMKWLHCHLLTRRAVLQLLQGWEAQGGAAGRAARQAGPYA